MSKSTFLSKAFIDSLGVNIPHMGNRVAMRKPTKFLEMNGQLVRVTYLGECFRPSFKEDGSHRGFPTIKNESDMVSFKETYGEDWNKTLQTNYSGTSMWDWDGVQFAANVQGLTSVDIMATIDIKVINRADVAINNGKPFSVLEIPTDEELQSFTDAQKETKKPTIVATDEEEEEELDFPEGATKKEITSLKAIIRKLENEEELTAKQETLYKKYEDFVTENV